MASRDAHFLLGEHIAHHRAIELAIGTGKAGDLSIVGHDRPELCRRAQHADRQLRIISLRIVVQQRFFETLAAQLGRAAQSLPGTDSLMATDVEPSSHQVVHPQADIEHEGQAKIGGGPHGQAPGPTHLRIDRDHKGLWPHQERGMADHQPALDHALMDHREVKLGQVANAAVGQFGGLAAGSAGEIDFFHQCDTVAAGSCVKGNPRPSDAAADHQHIKLLSRQPFYICCSCSSC